LRQVSIWSREIQGKVRQLREGCVRQVSDWTQQVEGSMDEVHENDEGRIKASRTEATLQLVSCCQGQSWLGEVHGGCERAMLQVSSWEGQGRLSEVRGRGGERGRGFGNAEADEGTDEGALADAFTNQEAYSCSQA
jgi:hypothetical protein